MKLESLMLLKMLSTGANKQSSMLTDGSMMLELLTLLKMQSNGSKTLPKMSAIGQQMLVSLAFSMMQVTGSKVLMMMQLAGLTELSTLPLTGLKILVKTSRKLSTMLMTFSLMQVKNSMIGQRRQESLNFSTTLANLSWISLSQLKSGLMTLALLKPLRKLESGLSLRLTQLAMQLKRSGKNSQIGLRPTSQIGSFKQERISTTLRKMLARGSYKQVRTLVKQLKTLSSGWARKRTGKPSVRLQ